MSAWSSSPDWSGLYKGDDGIINEVKKRWNYCQEWESQTRLWFELDTKFAEVRNAAAMGTPEIYGKNTWKRGGGDTVIAGPGISITETPDGNKKITNNGAGITPIAVTGTIDDSNKTFSAATQPTMLNINGAFYLKTGGAYTWTWVATVITLNQPVGTGGSIFGI